MPIHDLINSWNKIRRIILVNNNDLPSFIFIFEVSTVSISQLFHDR